MASSRARRSGATVKQRPFAVGYIRHWEDGDQADPDRTHSMRPHDGGNWTGGTPGLGVLVGSNHGVTPGVLARHRDVAVSAITWRVMHSLAIDEAADIALAGFYREPGLDRLPWDPLVASVMDMGWGAGPFHGVQLLQRTVGALDDGSIGPGTAATYQAHVAKVGIEAAARAYAGERYAYYEKVIAARPDNAENRSGWRNRTASFLPGTAWWRSW